MSGPGAKRRFGAPALALGCVFLLLLFLNFHTQKVADDFTFSVSHVTWSAVTGFGDIIPNLRYMRAAQNGRVFPHFFAMCFLLLPKAVFNVVNAALATLLFALLLRYVRSGEGRRDLSMLGFQLGAIWLLTPAFGQVYLWLTGSCNYSWTMLLSLLFLLPFFRAWQGRDCFPAGGKGRALRAAYLPLAFLTGAWSENGALAALFAAFCFLALTARRERRLPRFLSAALLLGGCGFLFLMSAPSELSGRRGAVSESTLTRALAALNARLPGALLPALALLLLCLFAGLVFLFFKKRRLACRLGAALIGAGVLGLGLLLARGLPRDSLAAAAGALLSNTGLSLLLAAGRWAVLMLRALERGVPGETLLSALILGLAAFGSVAIFFFAAYFPARSACPAIVYTTLADALLLSALRDLGLPRPQRLAAWLLCLLAALSFPLALGDILRTDAQLRERYALLREQAIAEPGSLAVVEPVKALTKYTAFWPGDANYFEEEMGWCFGLSAVCVTEYADGYT